MQETAFIELKHPTTFLNRIREGKQAENEQKAFSRYLTCKKEEL